MKRLASYDPSNGDLLGEVPVTGTGQIGEIVNSALVASKSWRQLKTADRVQILARAYAQLESHFERLTHLLSREMGKDIRRASGEVSGVCKARTSVVAPASNTSPWAWLQSSRPGTIRWRWPTT